MIRFTARDGATFSGQKPADVVRAMRDANWQREQPKGEYMNDVIDRVQQMTGLFYTGRLVPVLFLDYLVGAELGTLEGEPGEVQRLVNSALRRDPTPS